MDTLLRWIKKIAVFMLLSGYMEHMIPSGYRRYFRMCMGFILILMISTPLLNLLNGDMDSEVIYLLEDMKAGSRAYQSDEALAEEFQAYYIEQYKNALEDEIIRMIEKEGLAVDDITLEIDENTESRQYGAVQKLQISLVHESGEIDISEITSLRSRLGKELGVSGSRIQIQQE